MIFFNPSMPRIIFLAGPTEEPGGVSIRVSPNRFAAAVSRGKRIQRFVFLKIHLKIIGEPLRKFPHEKGLSNLTRTAKYQRMTPIPISPFNKFFRYFPPHVLYYTKLLGQKA